MVFYLWAFNLYIILVCWLSLELIRKLCTICLPYIYFSITKLKSCPGISNHHLSTCILYRMILQRLSAATTFSGYIWYVHLWEFSVVFVLYRKYRWVYWNMLISAAVAVVWLGTQKSPQRLPMQLQYARRLTFCGMVVEQLYDDYSWRVDMLKSTCTWWVSSDSYERKDVLLSMRMLESS